jgi:hypothetical protein
MEVAPEVVEDGPERRAGRFGWAADNPLVRAIARVRAPLAAKLLVGFALVAALLALLAGLGLVSLGQSNTRGRQLLNLQGLTAYKQLLVTDGTGSQPASRTEQGMGSPAAPCWATSPSSTVRTHTASWTRASARASAA